MTQLVLQWSPWDQWYTNTGLVAIRSAIQFQNGLTLRELQQFFGTEEKCEAALEDAPCLMGFDVLAAMDMSTG